MTLNQRGRWTTAWVRPSDWKNKADGGMFGTGLYGGIIRDLKDPSKKTTSGK